MPSRTPTPRDGPAWVTGASSGIGRHTALALAREGWTVLASARSADKLEALAAESSGRGRIVALPCDITDQVSVDAALAKAAEDHAPIALAVLNAGIYEPDTVETLTVDGFNRTMDLNLTGTLRCLVPLVEIWRREGRGHAAIVSSVAGYRGLPRSIAYGTSKAALTHLTEALKFDFDRLGLKIQVVTPGFVRTPATDQNDFKMPAIMEPGDAAARLVQGLKSDRFEITFPRRFTWSLRALRCMPYEAYFSLIKRQTGAGKT